MRAQRRCPWADGHALLQTYHDEEWGVPVHDDRQWFEKLILDGAQAGLSWLTILKKREGYRSAFAGFDPERVVKFGARDVDRLMANPGIVRNRLKIKSAIGNAAAFLKVGHTHGSFDQYIWARVGGKPIRNRVRTAKDCPTRTPLSDEISAELRTLGFSFVGSTIVYAFMQASGLVNDHLTQCFRHAPVARLR